MKVAVALAGRPTAGRVREHSCAIEPRGLF